MNGGRAGAAGIDLSSSIACIDDRRFRVSVRVPTSGVRARVHASRRGPTAGALACTTPSQAAPRKINTGASPARPRSGDLLGVLGGASLASSALLNAR